MIHVDYLHILSGFWPLLTWLVVLLGLQVLHAFGKL
jgi:hypothetical protein